MRLDLGAPAFVVFGDFGVLYGDHAGLLGGALDVGRQVRAMPGLAGFRARSAQSMSSPGNQSGQSKSSQDAAAQGGEQEAKRRHLMRSSSPCRT